MSPYDWCSYASEAYDVSPDVGKADSASRAIIRTLDDVTVVAFRGSDDILSWIHDIDALLITIPKIGNIHLGFWSAWRVISKEIKALVKDRRVVFVGHSLGAALALIAAADCKLAGIDVKSVYAFEPPRISPNNITSAFFGIEINLYRNGLDIVTSLPIGWQHPSSLISIGKPSWPWVNVKDHFIANVLEATKK